MSNVTPIAANARDNNLCIPHEKSKLNLSDKLSSDSNIANMADSSRGGFSTNLDENLINVYDRSCRGRWLTNHNENDICNTDDLVPTNIRVFTTNTNPHMSPSATGMLNGVSLRTLAPPTIAMKGVTLMIPTTHLVILTHPQIMLTIQIATYYQTRSEIPRNLILLKFPKMIACFHPMEFADVMYKKYIKSLLMTKRLQLFLIYLMIIKFYHCYVQVGWFLLVKQ